MKKLRETNKQRTNIVAKVFEQLKYVFHLNVMEAWKLSQNH